jgi:hypothetical protein
VVQQQVKVRRGATFSAPDEENTDFAEMVKKQCTNFGVPENDKSYLDVADDEVVANKAAAGEATAAAAATAADTEDGEGATGKVVAAESKAEGGAAIESPASASEADMPKPDQEDADIASAETCSAVEVEVEGGAAIESPASASEADASKSAEEDTVIASTETSVAAEVEVTAKAD